MFGAAILARNSVLLNIPQWEGARSRTFLWLGDSRDGAGERPFQFPWNPAEAPPLGAVGVEAADGENL